MKAKDRHQCEVRFLLALTSRSTEKAREYLELVEKKRGAAAVNRLKRDAREQMNRGNRGEWGDWRIDAGAERQVRQADLAVS